MHLYFTIELNLSHFPKGKFFSVKTSTTNFDKLSKTIINWRLSITLVLGLNGQSVVLSILGPLTQLLSLRASEEIPRVPVSAGLSPLSMWCHWSVVVESRISPVRLPTKTGSLLQEWSHWRTVVLSVHKKISVTSKARPLKISSFKRVARRAAWSSNFGIESAFIGATRALLNTKANSVWWELASRARRKATAQKTSCELSPNIGSSIRPKGSVK